MAHSSSDTKPTVLARYPTGEPVLNALPSAGADAKKAPRDKGQLPKADAAPKKKKKP